MKRVRHVHTRMAPRIACCRDLSVTYEGFGEEIEVRAPDFSPEGMFINTIRVFPEGAVLKISFRLGRSGVPVQTRAEVRYCLPGVGVGVEFLDLSDESRRSIALEMVARGETTLQEINRVTLVA